MTRQSIRIVHEGKYAAEVPVNLIEDDGGWAPYLSFEDATKIADVARALRRGDITAASKLGRVFELLSISA